MNFRMNCDEKPAYKRGWLILAGVFLAAALFFKFALLGYSTMAYVYLFISVIILLFCFFDKKGFKKLTVLLLILIVLGSVLFAYLEIPIIHAAKTDDRPESDYLVVLGAGVNGSTPSLSMLERLNAALDYMESYPQCIAIVTGCQGNGEDISESQAMYTWLANKGISPGRIIIEDKSTSTQENIGNALSIIRESDADFNGTIAICSSEYHIYRAKLIASEEGCKPVGVAGRTKYPILRANYFIREAFAVLYMRIFG